MLSALLTAAVLAAPAGADTLPPPRAEYSASQTLWVNGIELSARVNHAAGKERREATIGGLPSVLILRPDLGEAFLVQPQSNIAMRLTLGEAETGPDLSALHLLQATPEATDPFGGEQTVRYRVEGGFPDGGAFTGRVWATEDGLYVRLEGEAVDEGERLEVRMQLHDIVRGRQVDSLFETPPGAEIMDLVPLVGRTPDALKPGERRPR